MAESKSNVFDDFIAEHKLVEKTQLSQSTLREIVKKAMFSNNFAYIFADVVDYFIRDCDEYLNKLNKAFSFEAKKHFKEMKKHIVAAKKCSEKLCGPMYHNAATEDMCANSDWWLALIKLVDDRITGDIQKTQMLLEFLLNMPEGNSPYKVKYDDFKVFKD